MRKFYALTAILFLGLLPNIFAQKGRIDQKNPPRFTNNANCTLAVSIDDRNPGTLCSELVKTLIAITPACVDTTVATYRWSSNVGGVFSTARTADFNLPKFLVATSVTFTVWVKNGTDSLSANISFTVKPRPSRPTISPVGTIVLCNNNAVILNASGCSASSVTSWSNGTTGVNSISVPAIGGTYFKVACEKNGCVSDSTAAAALITGIVTPPPTVTNKTICEGTPITAGNGLQAQHASCGGDATGTYTYMGGTVGYDQGLRSTNAVDPSVVVPTNSLATIKKVSISITWRKQKGGFQNSCGVGDTESWPYHTETQFRIKSPSGKIITLVNTNTYGGANNPQVTTVFEDGASPVSFYNPPVSGTFSSAEPLSGFIGENASGTWTLLPYDAVWKDPLCVSGFAISFIATNTNGTLTWWDAPTGGNQVGTGSEYIPTNTTVGTYTYYAQGQCNLGCPSTRTATTLTILPTPAAPTADVNVPLVNGTRSICGGESITLTATGGCENSGGYVRWYDQANNNFGSGNPVTITPYSGGLSITYTYRAICQGGNFCQSAVSNILSVVVKSKPSKPIIAGPGNSVCVNTPISLSYLGCNGTVGWTGNRTGSSINFNLTNNVNIKASCTINGCTSDSSDVYSITALPRPNPVTITSSSIQAVCKGNNVTLTATGCTPTQVRWTGGYSGSPLTITPLVSRSFKAACLGVNGCPSDSSAALTIVVLPKTKPTITGQTSVCGTQAITLTATGCSGANETVMWRNEDTGTTFNATITQNQTFRAVCIRNGTCVSDSSDIFTVNYYVKPAMPTIATPSNSTLCQGSSVTLTASGCLNGTTYKWTGGLSGSSISVSPSTTKSYKVACNLNSVCSSDSSGAVVIMVTPKPAMPTINQTNVSVCSGQSTVLSVSPVSGGVYNWTGGLTGTSVTVSTTVSKSYKVAVTSSGCTSDSASITVNVISINAPNLTLSCTNSLPTKIWDKVEAMNSGQVRALLSSSDKGTFTVLQESYATKIAKFDSSGATVWSRYLNVVPPASSPYISTAVQTSDGGYLLGGYVYSSLASGGDANFATKPNTPGGTATYDYWVLKINSSGITQWSKNFGGNQPDKLSGITNTADGGYLLIGITSSSQGYDVTEGPLSASSSDGWMVKINSIGTKIWDKRFRPSTLVSGMSDNISVKESNDGGFLLGATLPNTSSTSSNNYDNFYTQKVNSLGVKEWENYYAPSQSSANLTSIAKTNDGGFVLGGIVGTPTYQYLKPWVVKINSQGVKQWDKILLGTGGAEVTTEVMAVPNENNFLVGITSSSNLGTDKSENSRGNYDMWLVKIKADGTKIWDKTLGGVQQDYLSKIAIDVNQGITLGGFSASTLSGDKTSNTTGAWIVKLNSNCPITTSVSMCRGDSVVLKANGCAGIITWSDGQTGSLIVVKPTITTSYTATCTSSGCVSASSSVFTINVSNQATPTITTTNSAICRGSNATLTASGCTGGAYAWTGGLTGTSVTVSPTATKSYKVACTVNACVSDSSVVTVINVTNLSGFAISSNKSSVCVGDTATLTATGCTGTLLWSNNLTTNIIKVTPQTTTTYTATCAVGICSFTQQISISTVSTPNVTAPTTSLSCGQTITLTANNILSGSNIQWRKDGVDISGATGNTYSANSGGNYDFINYILQLNTLNNTYSSFVSDVKFINSLVGFYCSDDGRIYKTIDGGVNWINVHNTTYSQVNFTFVDSMNGWAIDVSGRMSKTTDGGTTWVTYSTGALINNAGINKIAFQGLNVGIIVGVNSQIYYTNNQAQNWYQASGASLSSNPNFKSIAFVPNTTNVYVVGSSGILMKSTNNGASWSQVTSGIPATPSTLNDIVFTSSNNGWIVGDGGIIYKTIDGGLTWQLQASGTTNRLAAIQFVNNQSGYITGSQVLLKTSNGGFSWNSLTTSGLYNTQNLSFLNENNGWIASQYGLFKYIAPQCPTTSIILTAPQTPNAPNITPPANSTICQGSSVTLSASGCTGGTYAWTGGLTGSSVTVSPTATRNYKVACTVGVCVSDSSAVATVTVFNSMYSIISGNWDDASTWSCGREPLLSDNVTISTGNIVTIRNANAKAKKLLNNGQVSFVNSTSKLTFGTGIPPIQTITYTSQPGPADGKDSDASSYVPNTNSGNNNFMDPWAWTQGGSQSIKRCFVGFDLSSIPTNAVIDSAFFSLYFSQTFLDTYPGFTTGHIGDNSLFIKRITSTWTETGITWNTQPSTTNINQLLIPAATNERQNYPKMNVKNMVADMVVNPTNSYGFMIMHQVENPYKLTVFTTSEDNNPNIRPKLQLYYHLP